MITCEEVQKNLSAYCDGELPEPAADRISAHLQTCAACDSAYREYETLTAMFRMQMQQIEAPMQVEQMIMSMIEARQSAYQAIRLKRGILLIALVMLAAVAAMTLSPLGKILWSVLHILGKGLRVVFDFGRLAPTVNILAVIPSAAAIVCFCLSVVCALFVVKLVRRWNEV